MKLNYRSLTIIIISALISNQPLQAQHSGKHRANASLNIYTHTNDSVKQSAFNVGFFTNIEQLKGVGINAISSVVKKNAYGVQLSGLANMNGNNMAGFQLGGITNINGNSALGMLASGLVNLTGHHANGVSLSGGINIAGQAINGFGFAGLMNVCGGDNKGVMASGLANISANNAKGVTLSGLMNVSAKDLEGVQIASLLNITGDKAKGTQISAFGNVSVDMNGLQMAGVGNICAQNMKGVQIGLANYAKEMKGTQLGLLNLCVGEVKGVQIGLVNHSKDTTTVKIGLVNVSPKTRIQLLAYGGNNAKFNLAVRFKNRMTYTMLGVGAPYLKLNDKFSGALFYRAGLYWTLLKQLEISGDVGYYHIENFDNESDNIPARMYSLQARINLEYHPIKKFGIFASGGYGVTRYYSQDKTFENKPIIEFGIVLF